MGYSRPLFLVRTKAPAAFVCDTIKAVGFGRYPECQLECEYGDKRYTVISSQDPTIEIIWEGTDVE